MNNISIKKPYACIGAVVSVMLGCFCGSLASSSGHCMIVIIASSICFMSTFVPMVAVSHNDDCINIRMKKVSMLMFIVMSIYNGGSAIRGIDMPGYPLTNVFLVFIYFLIFSRLCRC